MLTSSRLKLRKNTVLLLFAGMLLVSFAALNIGSALLGAGHPLDLTADNRYTLSPNTQKLLDNNRSAAFIRLYLSENLENDYPVLAQHARYVSRFLEQYKIKSHNRINYEVVSVRPYERSENDAKKQNIRGFLDTSGKQQLYFGAVFSNERGDTYTIPYFEPQRQNYLEHDISRILSKLAQSYIPKNVGVISPSLNVMSGGDSLDFSADWPFIKMLRQDYNVEYLPAGNVSIPLKYDAVFLINPLKLSNVGLYAIDQYLMRGGKVIMFLDPFSESFLSLNGYINNAENNLPRFLDNLGIGYNPWKIAGDETRSRETLVSSADGSQILNYPLWLELTADNINRQHPVTEGLERLRLNSAASFDPKGETPYKTSVLFETTEKGGTVSADIAQYSPKSAVREAYKPDGRRHALAVLTEGRFPSFYKQNPLGENASHLKLPMFLITSVAEAKLLLVGDSDMLNSGEWNAGEDFKGAVPYDFIPINNNPDFIERAADYLTGSTALLSLPPKRILGGGDSMDGMIADKVAADYWEKLNLYEKNMQKAMFEEGQLQRRIAAREVFPSVTVVKKMEQLQRDFLSNQEKLKALRFKIQQQIEQQKLTLIIMTTMVWPLAIILAVALAFYLLRRYNRRLAKEYTHE